MMDYSTFLDRLNALGLFSMDLSLDRMKTFVERLGRPACGVIQVVGTNGKGSTATILAELLRAHGLRTGLYTSPHFVTPRERIRVDGAMLSEADWAKLGERVLALSAGLELTYFELLTALALMAFVETGCDAVVLEAGLGGRFDATTAVPCDLTVYTPIGLDHMKILGPKLADIAKDKAGAMRPGGLALTAPQDPEAHAVLKAEAERIGARLVDAGDVAHFSRAGGVLAPGLLGRGVVPEMRDVVLRLAGPYQELNAGAAFSAFALWAGRRKIPVRAEACRAALAQAFIPGRFQCVPAADGEPALILDGGHNAHGLTALGRALKAADVRPGALVFGCLRDKPLEEMLPIARTFTSGPVLACGVPSCPRACDPDALAAALGPDVRAYADVHAALAALSGSAGPVLVCGSLYLLGEFYTKHVRLLEPPA